MKKVISILLSVCLLLSLAVGVDFSAYADQSEIKLDDKINDKTYTFAVTDEDYSSSLYDFVAEKLGVNPDEIYIILGDLCSRLTDKEDVNYANNTIGEYIDAVDSLKDEGFDVNGELIIDYTWGTGENYNKNWLGNYEEVNEYHIKTAYDLAALYKACFVDGHTFEGKTIYVDSDIDLSEHFWMIGSLYPFEGESVFPPFSGVIEGNKNMICGLRFYPVGGFAAAGLLPNIKNAVIKDLYVYGEATRANVDYFGFIAGYAKDSAVVNCYAQGKIECIGRDRKYSVGAVGALLGETHHCAVINCGASANISFKLEHIVQQNYSASFARIGALIGRATNDEQDSYCIINSFAHGNINIFSKGYSANFGGFAGICDDDVYNCYSDTVVNCPNNVQFGSLAGRLIAERIVKDENNNSQILGEYIIDNFYCSSGTAAPFGVIESQSGKTTDDFVNYYEGAQELLDSLNSGLSGADNIINAHRDILSESSWADLLKQCGGGEVNAYSWKINSKSNMPELDFCYCHEYTKSTIEATANSNEYAVYTCKHCGKSYSVENEGTRIEQEPEQGKAKGWVKKGKKWYFFNNDGIMQTGWLKYKGKWYYLKANGVMKTGWLKYRGKWYYLKLNGKMKTGWLKKGKKRYYFKSNGVMLKNTSRKIGRKTYRFNASGVCINM